MSSNGGFSQNGGQDYPRGGQSNRFRSGRGRGRGRNSSEKPGQSRGGFNNSGKDRRASMAGRDGFSRQNEPDSIDILDRSQWPSIQESSTKNISKGRSSLPPTQDKALDRPVDDHSDVSHDQTNSGGISQQEFANQRRSTGYMRGQYQNQGGYQSEGGYSAGSYGNRQYGNDRYQSSSGNGNRQRSPRYYNSNFGRGYQNSGVRRHQRTYYNHPQAMYVQPEGVYIPTPFVEPQFYNPAPQYPSFPERRPKVDVDPVKQVEYYFSTENLKTDTYIRKKMDSEGWVDLSVVFNFNRIQRHKLAFEEFLDCVKKSDLLDVDLENNRVRTKDEPTKWVLKPDQELDQPQKTQTDSSYSAAQASDVQSSQYPYGAIPFFIPGYSSQRGRIPYHMYQTHSYYGAQFPDYSVDPSYSYYPQEYSSYPDYNFQAYQVSMPSPDRQSFQESVTSLQKASNGLEGSSVNNGANTSENNRVEDGNEELTQKMSGLNVSNSQVSC